MMFSWGAIKDENGNDPKRYDVFMGRNFIGTTTETFIEIGDMGLMHGQTFSLTVEPVFDDKGE